MKEVISARHREFGIIALIAAQHPMVRIVYFYNPDS
jgi:uncharacterized membrane protein